MSTEDKQQLVRWYYEEVVSTGNVKNIGNFISPDYVEVYNNERHSIGLKGAEEHVLGVRKTYPDLRLTVERQISEGDWVVTQITARGTHLGLWMGIKPTGRVVKFTGVNVDRVVDGRIVEHGGAANLLKRYFKPGPLRLSNIEPGRWCSESAEVESYFATRVAVPNTVVKSDAAGQRGPTLTRSISFVYVGPTDPSAFSCGVPSTIPGGKSLNRIQWPEPTCGNGKD